jgi:hypothetical protein
VGGIGAVIEFPPIHTPGTAIIGTSCWEKNIQRYVALKFFKNKLGVL